MDTNQHRSDRLLVRTAQVVGSASILTAFLVLSTPQTIGTPGYWVALPLLALCGVFVALLTWRFPRSMGTGLALAAFALAFALAALTPSLPPAAGYAVLTLLGAMVPGAAMIVLTRRHGHLVFWLVGAVVIGVAILTLGPTFEWFVPLVLCSIGWGVAYAGGVVLVTSVPLVLRQVSEIGLAHRAERQASELEAQRRQSARLLHDTVLATLTLLAHSGIGVSTEALRGQARNDAHLLRQLRLGEPLFALPGAQYAPEPVEESTLGTTLESVRERFDGLGLNVAWHGLNRLALPQHVLDAFLFSISECLENVRRHSGVGSAHVTVTEDEKRVQAMITDAGKGFAVDEVGEQRLGIKESVVGRLAEVGGTARVFSAPGAGTTVLLEVPR